MAGWLHRHAQITESMYSHRLWPLQSHVAEDGVLHVVAEAGSVAATLACLDLAQARILRSLACFWGFRVQCVPSHPLAVVIDLIGR